MSIGKIKAELSSVCEGREGYEIRFSIKDEDRDELFSLLRELRKRNAMSETRVLLEVQPYVCGAELNRSRLLWLLFEILSQARSRRKGDDSTARDCFADYMEAFGVHGVKMTCEEKEYERAMQLLPTAVIADEEKGVCKVFPSIASLEPERTAALIDSVFDELILLGTIHDEDVQYLYNQWHQ